MYMHVGWRKLIFHSTMSQPSLKQTSDMHHLLSWFYCHIQWDLSTMVIVFFHRNLLNLSGHCNCKSITHFCDKRTRCMQKLIYMWACILYPCSRITIYWIFNFSNFPVGRTKHCFPSICFSLSWASTPHPSTQPPANVTEPISTFLGGWRNHNSNTQYLDKALNDTGYELVPCYIWIQSQHKILYTRFTSRTSSLRCTCT